MIFEFFALVSKASIILAAILSKLKETNFSFMNDLNETSKEKVTSQKDSPSTNDQFAIRFLKGAVLPVINIVFNFLSITTLVKKVSEVNFKFITILAEKCSCRCEKDLLKILTSEQNGMKSVYDFTSPTTFNRSLDLQS